MNYLITGANGFIGKAVTKKILNEDKDCNIYAVVTSEDEMLDIKSKRIKIIVAFFDDYSRLASLINDQIDVVIHLAWCGLSGPSAKNLELQLSNVIATNTLLSQIKLLGVKRFIFASSMNVLEVTSFLLNPSMYKSRGVYVHVSAKIMSETISRVICEENGIQYNDAIIAMAYGENNKSKMIPNVFIQSLLKNKPPKLVSGNNLYDIIYIDDIANAFVSIVKKGVNKKSYYVGHNWNKTFKEIFTEIKDILNPQMEIQFGAYPEDNQIDYSLIKRDELFKDTGWEPIYDFKLSILNTAKWIDESKIDFLK